MAKKLRLADVLVESDGKLGWVIKESNNDENIMIPKHVCTE